MAFAPASTACIVNRGSGLSSHTLRLVLYLAAFTTDVCKTKLDTGKVSTKKDVAVQSCMTGPSVHSMYQRIQSVHDMARSNGNELKHNVQLF